jgi:hypothetical protein
VSSWERFGDVTQYSKGRGIRIRWVWQRRKEPIEGLGDMTKVVIEIWLEAGNWQPTAALGPGPGRSLDEGGRAVPPTSAPVSPSHAADKVPRRPIAGAEPGRVTPFTRRETYMSTRNAAIGSSRSSESVGRMPIAVEREERDRYS